MTATAVLLALDVKILIDSYYDVTVVKVHLPIGAGNPIQTKTDTTSTTRLLVPITYSKCTTYSSGKSYVIPPITKSPMIYLTPPVAAKMSVLSTFVSEEYKTYYTATSTYAVAYLLIDEDTLYADDDYSFSLFSSHVIILGSPHALVDRLGAWHILSHCGPNCAKTACCSN